MAALAATASFAQVTLTGNLDFANYSASGTQIGAAGRTVSTTTGVSSTSVIKIQAVEDLGGGMVATALYGLDPRKLSNDDMAFTNTSDTTKNTLTGLGRDELFVGLAGNFGNVRLGSPNSLGLEAHGASSPLGTGIGSGFAPNSGTMMNSIVNVRYSRSLRYDSPVFGGASFSYLTAAGNDEVQVDPLAGTQIPNARNVTEVALKFVNGPLSLNLTSIRQAKQVNKTGGYSGAFAAGAAPEATSATVFGASYVIGATTLYAGSNTGSRLAATSATDGTAVSSKGTRYAVKHSMGNIDLIAQMSKQKALEVEAKVTGARVDYNLSKTAAVYLGYEKWDTGAVATAGTGGASAALTGDRSITSIGLRKSF